MKWNILTHDEAKEYIRIRNALKLYEGYMALKPKEKILVTPIECPSDEDLIKLEHLSMKGWGMKTEVNEKA